MAALHEAELKQTITRNRWKTRRRMAKISFALMVFETLFLLFATALGALSTDTVRELGTVIISSYGAFSAILMVYIGAAAYDDVHRAA